MLHKRKIFLRLTVLILCAVMLIGCTSPVPNKSPRQVYDGFSIHFLDVGEGDSIFVRFSDGKNMLIDSGERSEELSEFIIGFLDNYGVKKIDYLVLTHPDLDHAGNAADIIDEFEIGIAYLPDMRVHINLYTAYEQAYNKLEEKKIEISSIAVCIKGEDYGLAFLSPNPSSSSAGSSYRDFNASQAPEPELSNAMSPIIYLEARGVRFVLTGDAPFSQEEVALKNANVLNSIYASNGVDVNLENVDFLKVSHHGANDASRSEFLSVLKPKNAVISVGGDNNYGHPNRDVLERLYAANQSYNLWRTDVYGTISVQVDKNGKVQIITDRTIS